MVTKYGCTVSPDVFALSLSLSGQLSATRRPTRAAPQLQCWRLPVPLAAGAGGGHPLPLLRRGEPESLRSPFRRRVESGGKGDAVTIPPRKAPLPKLPVAHSVHFVRGRKLGRSGKGLVAREAREPGWSQRPGAASAFKMQIDSSHHHPPPAPGARLRGSAAAAHASCALRRPSGRLYLRGARGATQHLPGARGRGGRSAPGLSGAHGGALVLLGSARLSAAAGAQG